LTFGGERGKVIMAERINHDSLVMQLERSERDFREGNVTSSEEVNAETACNDSVRRWCSGTIRSPSRKEKQVGMRRA
jgi:hypothetical protein